MRSRKTDRLTMESNCAVPSSAGMVLYQPIGDRAIAGFEALARWDHPKLAGCRRRNSYRSPKSG